MLAKAIHEDLWGTHYLSLICEPNEFYHDWKTDDHGRAINHINSEVASKKEQGFWMRIFAVTIDRDLIAGWDKDLDRVLLLFNVRIQNTT